MMRSSRGARWGSSPALGFVASASRQELEEFLLLMRPTLMQLASRVLHDQEDVQDAVQETVFRALRGFPRLDPNSNPTPWLLRICQNCCVDTLRQRTSQRRRAQIAQRAFSHYALCSPDLDSNLAGQDAVTWALAQLPQRDRILIVGHCLEGVSLNELAERLETPIGTIKSQLNRGRKRLKTQLQLAV